MKLSIYCILTLLDLTNAETGEAYHGPPQARELFTYNDRLFYFYSDRVPYDEGNAICEASDMHLTNLDEPGKAKFAAQSISEAWMVFEDMWIGAKKGDLGKWVWLWTNKRIPEEPQMLGNYSYMYPPWVDNEIPARDGKDCLAVDRNGHNDPYFVDLDCKLPRPFICEQNLQQKKFDPWNGGIVNIYEMEFMLYHGRLTWSAAVSFCRQQGFALATIDNMSVARKLAKAMLKSRPEFEDAWIGANFKDDQWMWVENGEEIKTIPAEYKNPNMGEEANNVLTPQFPPWFEAEPRKGRECAIFDRHLCDEPRFIDLKCNRQRDFICVKREEVTKREDETVILDRAKKRYIFFPVTATWDEAKKICDEEGDTTTMLSLNDIEETRFIMQAMSDARKPIDHLWLGGRIIGADWLWVGKEIHGETNKKIPMRSDETGFPPWCDNETNLEMACLNLDRQNHWTPLIYGLECNSTESVVCEQPIEPNDRIVQYEGTGDGDPTVSVRISKLIRNPISWYEAERYCKKDIGQLWRPRFDLPDSQNAIDKFYAVVKKGQDKEIEGEVYHVDGGTYSLKQKTWLYNAKPVNISTEWEPYDGDCLVGQINNTATNWTWYPVRCYHKLYSQVICQPRCSLTEVPYERENSEWICDAASSDIFDHKMTNMGCSHRCPDNQVTRGPERYYCGKQGWFSTQANVPVQSSKCKDLSDGLDLFKRIPGDIAILGFILDSTSDSPADYNATKFLIGNLIDFYRVHAKNVVVYVVSIEADQNGQGEGAVVKTREFKPTDDCELIKKEVLQPLVDTGEGIRDYAAGLSKIKEVVGDSMLAEAHIVFIIPEGNQKSLFKDKAREINEVANVYAIGTNRHAPIGQLVDVASKVDGESYAIQFKKPTDVTQSVKALMTSCTDCKCGSAFNELVEELEHTTLATPTEME